MRRNLKSMLVIVFLVGLASSAQAAPALFGWGGEEIIKVADFPNTDDFKYGRGEYVDAGYVYKQVSIFFIPIWNYDGRWVGYLGKNDTYLQLTKAELEELAGQAKVKLPASPSLPFWEAIGGKLVLGLIVLLYLGWRFVSRSGSEETEPLADQA